MKKLTPEDLEGRSPDIAAENLAKLKALFPEIVTEGPKGASVNVDVLKALIGDGTVTDAEEKYGLNWHGKRRARQLALTPSTGTLRPCPEESVDWDTTQNLMIEGDNLEVLKLLQKSYAGRVKLIYIDPPYNTGNDFVYPDDYADSIGRYLRLTGQDRAEGGLIASNAETSGRFHTAWLNMMYPRLKLGRSLLGREGVLLVSADDHEVQHLRNVLDELFGEENFVAQNVWQRSKKGDAKLIATVHEYILCYARDKAASVRAGPWRRKKDGAQEVLSQYVEIRERLKHDHLLIRAAMREWFNGLAEDDPRKAHRHYNWSDDRGLYFAADFAGPDDGRESRPRHDILHPVTGKPCKKPSTGWRWDEVTTKAALAEAPPRIHFGSDETTIPNRKVYLEEVSVEPSSSVFYRDGRSATLEVERLVGKGWFPFPKNADVISEFVELIAGPDDTVLDFFAGSGTTGQSVYESNVRQGARRRFILVQLPEPTGREQYPTIADITRERLRQSGKLIRGENPMFAGDLGFRVYKLDATNLQEWKPNSDDLDGTLLKVVDHVKANRTEADLLYEVLLKLGLDLCVPIETRTMAGKGVQSVGGGVLMACLADKIAREDVEALGQGIVEWRKALAPAGDTTCIFRDAAFADDVAKTNLASILEQNGIKKVRSL